MRLRHAVVGGLLTSLAIGSSAFAHPVQISMKAPDGSSVLNDDVIVNTTDAGIDETQEGIDFIVTFMTQAAADELCIQDPDGLPNRGIFAANTDHPRVNLPYENSSNDNNALRLTTNDVKTKIAVPKARYSEMHLFAASSGDTVLNVTFKYKDGTSKTSEITIPDWFADPPVGAYALASGRDRAADDGSQCSDENGASIFGFPFDTKTNKALKAVHLTKTGGDMANAILGITGVPVE